MAGRPWGADEQGPEELTATLRRKGGHVEHLSMDLSAPDAPAALIDAARSAFGHVDAVVANHARSVAQGLEELTAAERDLSFAVNTRATLLLVKAFAAQHDDDRPGGRVLLFTAARAWASPAR
jgi:3-oxoacyl-[acyl-carrier protein] reductase